MTQVLEQQQQQQQQQQPPPQEEVEVTAEVEVNQEGQVRNIKKTFVRQEFE